MQLGSRQPCELTGNPDLSMQEGMRLRRLQQREQEGRLQERRRREGDHHQSRLARPRLIQEYWTATRNEDADGVFLYAD